MDHTATVLFTMVKLQLVILDRLGRLTGEDIKSMLESADGLLSHIDALDPPAQK